MHGITETDHAAYAEKPAWHGLGTVVKDAMTSEEAIKAAKIDWNVVQVPVMYDRERRRSFKDPVMGNVSLSEQTNHQEIKGMVANIRSDTGDVLGVVSTRYKPIQNIRAFEFLDSLVMDGILKYESCGSLWGGEAIWLLARMPKADRIVSDDFVERYILFANWHNGKKTATTLPTQTRVVCWNTLNIALSAADWRVLNITHKGNIDEKLDQARLILGLTEVGFQQYADLGRDLASIDINAEKLREYINTVFPMPEEPTTRIENKVRDARHGVFQSFEHPTNMIPEMRHTAWAALNAVTHYMDHRFKMRRSPTEEQTQERRFWHTMDPEGTIGTVKARAEKAARHIFLEDDQPDVGEVEAALAAL